MKLVLQGFSGKMGKVVYKYFKENGYTFVGLFDEKHKIQAKKIAKCLCNSQKSYTFAVKKTKNK